VAIPRAADGGSITSSGLLQLSMSLGIAAVGTFLIDSPGHSSGPAAFVRATDHGLLVAIGFLVCAAVAVLWLPRHAREHDGRRWRRAGFDGARPCGSLSGGGGEHFVAVRGETAS
jgi:hypothetical protein